MSAENDLIQFMQHHTTYVPDGFIIDIRNHDELDELLKKIGIKKGYQMMADIACKGYEETFKEPFLFSNACVAYEIEYHTDAYMCMMKHRGYIRNITTFVFTRRLLVRACEDINISTCDVYNLQSILFQYYKGIRNCYKKTNKDPYKKFRL
ncbi:MAG: hypothetical protein HUJ53_03790 [Holdemanella sp.]|nr:hypothetical protein [Holdemanella sp.]